MEELPQNTHDKYTDSPYGRTLRFFDAYYPYDIEDLHYSELLLSMTQYTSIDELLFIRGRLRDKISKIIPSDIEKLPNDIIREFSNAAHNYLNNFNPSCTEVKDGLNKDVDSLYDEHVFRLFEANETITANICGEYYINILSERNKYKELIINVAQKKSNIDVTELLDSIETREKDFFEHWNKFKTFKKNMNGYNAAKEEVEDDFDFLKQFNWRHLIFEKSRYSIIDREEQRRIQEKHAKQRKEEERIGQIIYYIVWFLLPFILFGFVLGLYYGISIFSLIFGFICFVALLKLIHIF